MKGTTGILILAMLMALSLAMVSAINRWQTRNRIIQAKLRQLRQRVDLLEEINTGIAPLLEAITVPSLLNQEIVRALETAKHLAPDADYLDAYLQRASALADLFAQHKRSQPLNRMLTSDASIAKHRYFLEEAARELRRMRATERIEAVELEQLLAEINWAHTMVEVASLIGQAERVNEYHGELFAHAYYRKAHQVLLQSPTQDERRFRLIRELSEMLEMERKSLSRDLLPEFTSSAYRN